MSHFTVRSGARIAQISCIKLSIPRLRPILPILSSHFDNEARRAPNTTFAPFTTSTMPPKKSPASKKDAPIPKASLSGPRVLYWHRTDLRLHDSPALHAALELKPSVFIPCWTWDPHYVYTARVGANRWQFLTDCQRDLSESYTKINKKQRLWLVREGPITVLPKLWKHWKITHLVFEKDTDAYARDRDEQVMKLAKAAGVEVIVKVGRTLFDPDELVRHNGGKPTMSISQVEKAIQHIDDGFGKGVPAIPLDAPSSLPDPLPESEMDLSPVDHEIPRPPGGRDFNRVVRTKGSDDQYKSIMGPNKDFSVPSFLEMGIDPKDATTPHRGGETIALKMLEDLCANDEYLGTFEKPKTAPTAFKPQSTTLLSPHHHFGSISVRLLWHRTQEIYEKRKKAKKPNSSLPANMEGQLLFRDMYFGAQAALGYAFASASGNKICRFVDWHLPSVPSDTPVGEHMLTGTYKVDSPQAEEWFARYKEGRTGFPWIDALMRQLRREGWIHHLGRHAVACFLTRGGCYVHWERGAEVFEELLIDHETACNSGNWMWLSCTAFFAQFYRCYSPVAFPKKTDANGDFVREFVPELKGFDKKYIYEPHKAPIADQKKWGCLISGDGTETERDGMKVYPKPMFDFNERRQVCIDGVAKAYKVGMYGDDPRVLSGEWKNVFDFKEGSGEVKGIVGGEIKDTQDGLVERPKGKKRGRESDQNGKVENEPEPEKKVKHDDDAGGEEGEQAAAGGDEPHEELKEKAGIKGGKGKGGKKQEILDSHIDRKKAKK